MKADLDVLDSFDVMTLLSFLGDNWSLFESWCKHCGADPEKIYQALGGED